MKKPKVFDVNKAMTLNAFSVLTGVNRSSITKAVQNGKLVTDENDKILPAEWKNKKYIRRHLISAKRTLHRTESERAFDMAVLEALHTGGGVIQPAKYEKYSPDKIKISNDTYFYLYEIGVVEDQEFYPIAHYSKHTGREAEINVLPFCEMEICVMMKKGELSGFYIEDYCTTPLYMRLKE